MRFPSLKKILKKEPAEIINRITLPGNNQTFTVPEIFTYRSHDGICGFKLFDIITEDEKTKLIYAIEFGPEDPELRVLSGIEGDLAKVGEYIGCFWPWPGKGEKQRATFTIILLPSKGGYIPYIRDYRYPNFSVGLPSHYLMKYNSLDEAVSKAIKEVPVDFNAAIK